MGASIWAVSKKTSDDMADAAILNLNENLNLMEDVYKRQPVERLLEPLDVSRREHVGRVEGVLQVVDDVRVLGRAHRRALVVGLEGGENRLGVVHEVDDEDPVLAGARPVDARVGLHDLDGVAERLVDVEGD